MGIFLQEANGVTDSTFIDNLRLAAKELVENTQKTKKKKVTGLLAINCNTWFYGYVCLKPRKVITKGTCHNQIRLIVGFILQTKFAANPHRNRIRNPLIPKTATRNSPDFPEVFDVGGVRGSSSATSVDMEFTLNDVTAELG